MFWVTFKTGFGTRPFRLTGSSAPAASPLALEVCLRPLFRD